MPPPGPKVTRGHLFGAVCPRAGKGAALVLPFCNTAAVNLHLAAIGEMVSPGKHTVVMLDQAGWHLSGDVVVLATITLLPLLPKGPELNAMENIPQFMRGPKATPEGRSNSLSNRVSGIMPD
jgi:hypothetical protein